MMNSKEFDHYVALDWSQKQMAVAWQKGRQGKAQVVEQASHVHELHLFLKQLKGSKILTFEESTGAQWLYTSLKPYVTELLVCDPYRNKLLLAGAKTDKVDALKMLELLKAGLLKSVFHSNDQLIHLRKLASGYSDLINAGVRLKNQRSALFRSAGRSKEEYELKGPAEQFVLKGLDQQIERYEEERLRYTQEFSRYSRKIPMVNRLKSVPGISDIGAVKIAAYVVDASRFKGRGAFLAYCGLVKHEKLSGGASYGRRTPRFNHVLKGVFKTAAIVMVNKEGTFKNYYDHLRAQGCADHDARHAVSRRIAMIALGVMKGKKPFEEKENWIKKKSDQVA